MMFVHSMIQLASFLVTLEAPRASVRGSLALSRVRLSPIVPSSFKAESWGRIQPFMWLTNQHLIWSKMECCWFVCVVHYVLQRVVSIKWLGDHSHVLRHYGVVQIWVCVHLCMCVGLWLIRWPRRTHYPPADNGGVLREGCREHWMDSEIQ